MDGVEVAILTVAVAVIAGVVSNLVLEKIHVQQHQIIAVVFALLVIVIVLQVSQQGLSKGNDRSGASVTATEETTSVSGPAVVPSKKSAPSKKLTVPNSEIAPMPSSDSKTRSPADGSTDLAIRTSHPDVNARPIPVHLAQDNLVAQGGKSTWDVESSPTARENDQRVSNILFTCGDLVNGNGLNCAWSSGDT